MTKNTHPDVVEENFRRCCAANGISQVNAGRGFIPLTWAWAKTVRLKSRPTDTVVEANPTQGIANLSFRVCNNAVAQGYRFDGSLPENEPAWRKNIGSSPDEKTSCLAKTRGGSTDEKQDSKPLVRVDVGRINSILGFTFFQVETDGLTDPDAIENVAYQRLNDEFLELNTEVAPFNVDALCENVRKCIDDVREKLTGESSETVKADLDQLAINFIDVVHKNFGTTSAEFVPADPYVESSVSALVESSVESNLFAEFVKKLTRGKINIGDYPDINAVVDLLRKQKQATEVEGKPETETPCPGGNTESANSVFNRYAQEV